MKMKRICECSLITGEDVKFEGTNKEYSWRQDMDKPTAGKSMAWLLQGTAITMLRMTPARST
jgi:hypothetical protein